MNMFRQTLVDYLDEQVQIDFVDMGKYKGDKRFYRILTAIEIPSRCALAISVYGKDASNMTKAVTELLKQFKDRFG